MQSSVPTYKGDSHVPELHGKRLIEKRLSESPMQAIIIRNPAFMDVFLVFSGFAQAEDKSLHATTKRQYGFGKLWLGLVGNLVEKYGVLIAPGGARHGSPMIATRDVAAMLVGGALYEGKNDLLLEAGGPQWLTWREIADTISQKTGGKAHPYPPLAGLAARLNQRLASRFPRPPPTHWP